MALFSPTDRPPTQPVGLPAPPAAARKAQPAPASAGSLAADAPPAPATPTGRYAPSTFSPTARRSYTRELIYAFFFSTALAVIEGSVIAVIVKNAYAGVVPEGRLNLMVALLAAAPEMANITSFLWAALAHGRPKVRLLVWLQAAVLLLTLGIAFVPHTEPGLYILAGIVVAARVLMTGVVTLRSAIWRANYQRAQRTRITGNLSTVTVLIVAAVSALLGKLLNVSAYTLVYFIPAACALGALGVASYARLRVRRERALLRQERAEGRAGRPSLNPLSVLAVLRSDRPFAAFMLSMFLLGFGNIMLAAPLVIALKDRFNMGYFGGIMVMTTIPLIAMPLFIPMWAALLSRVHVVRFRAIHSWVFILAQTLVFLAVFLQIEPLLYAASLLLGMGYAGGSLAWNLGHLDFAPAHKAGQYMGVHVTLNGVRGILAPFLAVKIYQWLEVTRPGAGAWVFALSVVLCVAGALGFFLLDRSMGHLARTAPREK